MLWLEWFGDVFVVDGALEAIIIIFNIIIIIIIIIRFF